MTDYEEILSIILFRSLGEIQGPGDHRLPINDYYLIMGYGVFTIYFDRYSLVKKESG